MDSEAYTTSLCIHAFCTGSQQSVHLCSSEHRCLGSVIFAFKITLTTTLNHITCINTSRQVLEKTLFAINAIFTQDNNLSKTKQKTNATCSKCKTNLILTYLHQSWRHSSSQSQKRESTILSDKNRLLPNISSVNEIFGPTQCCPLVPCWKAFLKYTAREQESQSVQIVFCSFAVHVRKAFQQGTIAKHGVRKIKSVVDEILWRNLLLSDKIAEWHFCDCEDECLWDRWR